LTQGDLSHTRPSRAVLSLTEGDLIIGRKNLSAIGTLVERTTNYTMLLHLPDGYTPELVRDALAAKIKTLPEVLRASLTWDQDPEMGKWNQVAVDADIDIFFCDPHAPWQRATNENTVSLVVARPNWSGRLVPAASGDSREHWTPVGVPCVGPVP
jgi:IS30 family transposase